MVGNTVQGGRGRQGASAEGRGLWAISRPCRMPGKPCVCPELGGSGAQHTASVCSGRVPAPPGTSKREKQYQAHRAFGDRRDGVISARTYFYASEAKCDSHMETFLRCIEAAGGAPRFAGCAPAGEGRPLRVEMLMGESEARLEHLPGASSLGGPDSHEDDCG